MSAKQPIKHRRSLGVQVSVEAQEQQERELNKEEDLNEGTLKAIVRSILGRHNRHAKQEAEDYEREQARKNSA